MKGDETRRLQALRMLVCQLCDAHEIPRPEFEYRFHRPRRWKFDWCWPEKAVAVEQEGGIWIRGGHNRGPVYLSNMEKYNAATRLGWKLFRFTPQQVRAGEWIEWVKDLVKARAPGGRFFWDLGREEHRADGVLFERDGSPKLDGNSNRIEFKRKPLRP